MLRNFKHLIVFIFFISINSNSQNSIVGVVLDNQKKPLANATILSIDKKHGVISDTNGFFELDNYNNEIKKIIISIIGYENDTIEILNNYNLGIINLSPIADLNTINVKENKQTAFIDSEKIIKTEVITSEELTKAACCELAGCFETQISVESKTTNIITNTKELSILGLSGIYNQILIDGIPLVMGLNYTYGISSIPGTLINNIFISQGLASVLQGPESITGQINIDLKAKQKETFFLNLYINSFNVKQLNFDYNYSIKNWKGIFSFHTTQPGNKIDQNNDNFLDIPLTKKYSIYNKWEYKSDIVNNFYSSIILRYLNEERVGGDINYNPKLDLGTTTTYGQVINFQQPELIIKSSYKFNNSTIVFRSGASYHDQNSYFGIKNYSGNQFNSHSNLSLLQNLKSHVLEAGINYKSLHINEKIQFGNLSNLSYDGNYQKNERVFGTFLEGKFKFYENIEIITGLRNDYHNEFGNTLTPRLLLKYNITENCILRANAGSGWRTVNLFSEHIKILGSNEDIQIENNLKPEKAINFGFNFLQAIYTENFEFQLILDYYKTKFTNQIYPDYETNNNIIIIDNFENESFSKSFQSELGIEILKKIGIKIAYNFLDVYKDINGHKHRLPFFSKHHLLNTYSYRPPETNWNIDVNIHWFGRKKLQNTEQNPIQYQRPNYSSPYSIVNMQITREFINYDIYLGCENLFDFKQENPIIAADDPFGDFFNISNIWGPTRGREIYLGLRLTL